MDWNEIIKMFVPFLLKEGWTILKDKKKSIDALKRSEAELQQVVKEESGKSIIEWNKVGTLFWLGNDLMWIQDMMHRGALPDRVLQGVQHAEKYFNDLGFDPESFPFQQLSLAQKLLEALQGMSDLSPKQYTLLQQHYGTVDQYISNLKWYVDALVKGQQSGFEKERAFPA